MHVDLVIFTLFNVWASSTKHARSSALCVVIGILLACKRLLFLAFNSALSRIHKHQKPFQLTLISKLSHQFTKTIFQLSQIELAETAVYCISLCFLYI